MLNQNGNQIIIYCFGLISNTAETNISQTKKRKTKNVITLNNEEKINKKI
jgi:hypothetical protein